MKHTKGKPYLNRKMIDLIVQNILENNLEECLRLLGYDVYL